MSQSNQTFSRKKVKHLRSAACMLHRLLKSKVAKNMDVPLVHQAIPFINIHSKL